VLATGPVFCEPTRFAERFVINRLERLATASALNLDVGDLDRVAQGIQLSEQPIARFDELALAAQLVQALIAIAQPIVQPSLRIPQLSLDAPQRTC
jgi:hypothetical protein